MKLVRRSIVTNFLRHTLPPRQGMARAFRRAFREGFFFAVIAITNPFEIVTWSDLRSHELWEKFYAHDYPRHRHSQYSAGGRDNISVVYFDDASVKRQFGTRPLNSLGLLDMIDDIIFFAGEKTPPAAIFIDFVLDDAAPEDTELEELILATQPPRPGGTQSDEAARCDRRAAPRDVGNSSSGQTTARSLSPFRCLVLHVAKLTHFQEWRNDPRCQQSTVAKLQCIHSAHGLPLIFSDPLRPLEKESGVVPMEPSVANAALGRVAVMSPATIDAYDYPLVTPADEQARRNRPFKLYPAAAMFAAWCLKPERCATVRDHDRLGTDGTWPRAYATPVNVAWGVGPELGKPQDLSDPTRLIVADKAGCAPAKSGIMPTLLRIAEMSFSGLIAKSTPCPYARAFPSDIFQSASLSQMDGQAIAANKLVIVGGDFIASGDRVPAAPYGSVAGFYLHAMVLDNLLEFGAGYPKAPAKLIGAFNNYDILNVAIIIWVALVIGFARQKLAQSTGEMSTPLSRRIADRAIVTLAAAMILVAAYWLVTGNAAIVPANVNLVVATLFAVFGLIDLIFATFEPLFAELGSRLRRAESVLVHGQDTLNDGAP